MKDIKRMLKNYLLKNMPWNATAFSLCQRYVDYFKNENNNNILTNGEFHLMQRILPKCNIVFDVGAHVGKWTELALEIKPALNIHCFEPSQVTYKKLLGKGFPTQVMCNNVGLSSSVEKRILHVFEDGSTINSLYKRHGLEDLGLETQCCEEKIRLETLDAYCERHRINKIDYLKVDVEGHELEVFKGASQMLKKGQICVIQFEYGGANIDSRVLLKDLFDLFQGYGYTLHKIYPKELRQKKRYDQQLENFQYQNWVAIKSGGSIITE